MQKIPLNLAQEGMVLAKEVVRPDKPDGPSLFGKGMALTTAHIERLGDMGIQAVVVEGRPVVMEGEESLEELLAKMEARFARVKGNAVMDKMSETMGRHLSKMMEA